MSTSKVYGDAPNELLLVELEIRYDYADPADCQGIAEDCRVDACLQSVFGASKLVADVMVQEYGRYFGLPTVCFRGGCLTGPNHSGAELHGFLAYLARTVREGRTYRFFGYKGSEVRDNINSHDVCTAMLTYFEALIGRRMNVEHVETPRRDTVTRSVVIPRCAPSTVATESPRV